MTTTSIYHLSLLNMEHSMTTFDSGKLEGVWVAISMDTGEEVDRDDTLAELYKRNDQGVHYRKI